MVAFGLEPTLPLSSSQGRPRFLCFDPPSNDFGRPRHLITSSWVLEALDDVLRGTSVDLFGSGLTGVPYRSSTPTGLRTLELSVLPSHRHSDTSFPPRDHPPPLSVHT